MQNKNNLGLKFLLLVAPIFLFVALFATFSDVSAQNTTYPVATLTGENDVSLTIQTQAVSFSSGKWTYNFMWKRTRDAEGRFTIAPVTNEFSIVTDLDPAPREKTISSPLVARLDPGTRYAVKYYSAPSATCATNSSECSVIRTVYFNTRDESGRILATSEIPISKGGTMPDPVNSGSTNNTDNASITALQNQVNQLLALVQSLIARLSSVGGNTQGLGHYYIGTSTNLVNTNITTTVNTNAPAGFTCTGVITPEQANIIANDSIKNTSQNTYNVNTSTGSVTCTRGTTSSISSGSDSGAVTRGVYMWMKPNIFGYNGPRNAPEPIYVEVNGKDPFGAGSSDYPNITTSGDVTVETYASVGRNFVAGINFNIPATEACENNPKVKIEAIRTNIPAGLDYKLGPDRSTTFYDKGACTYARLQGVPTTPGRYLMEYKITSTLGTNTIVRTTKVYIVVKKTNVFPVNVVQNLSPNGSQVSNPEIGGRTLISWDQGGLRTGVTSFYRMDVWVAPGNQTGRNPDFITDKYLVATVQDDRLVCNSSTSGGSDPNLAWGCSRYNWLVGNTLGPNLTAGTYTIIVTPHIPVMSSGLSANFATNNENMVQIMYKNSDDGGTAYAYGSTVVNITGNPSAISSDTPGSYGDPSFMRGGISYVRKNQSGSVIGQGTVGFGAGQGSTININPTDTLELSWRAYFPASGNTPERDAGTAWGSGVRVSNGVTNYEVSTAQLLRNRTSSAFPNIPGGFDYVETEGFMNSARGTYTITGTQMQNLQGLGFSLRYTPYLYGCANLATFSNPNTANFEASTNTSVALRYGTTGCMINTSSSATLFVNVGTGGTTSEIPLGNANSTGLTTSPGLFNTDTCRLPDQINMLSAVSPNVSIYTLQDGTNDGTGYDSYTTYFADLSKWNDVSLRPYRYNKVQFMVSKSRDAVASGCASGGCLVNREVSNIGSTGINTASIPNRFGAQFVGGLEENTTYYNRLVYTCDGVSGSRDVIWPAVTTGRGTIGNLSTGGSGGNSGSVPAAPVVANTSCTIAGPNSFYAGWNDPVLPSGVTFNPVTNQNDRIVFRSAVGSVWTNSNGNWKPSNTADDTSAQTKIVGGCPGVADGSNNLATCVKNNNVTPGSNGATFYPITGANAHTTYWNRVAYVKDFNLPTIRIVSDKVWSCNMP